MSRSKEDDLTMIKRNSIKQIYVLISMHMSNNMIVKSTVLPL